MAKAPNQNGFDGEGRKLGEQTGLDTRKFLTKFSGVRLVNLFIKTAFTNFTVE